LEGSTRYREYQILASEKDQARFSVDHLPWHEVEELRCIEEYAMQRYESIFEKVAPHIPKKNYKPPENHRLGSPPGHHDVIGKYVLAFRYISRTNLVKGAGGWSNQQSLTCLGPEMLHGTINVSDGQLEQLVMSHVFAGFPPTGFSNILEYHESFGDYGAPNPRFQGQDRQPGVGWLWTSESNQTYPQNYHLRPWAYAMWDEERFEDWGISKKDLLEWPRDAND
jgi:hypothetical protein